MFTIILCKLLCRVGALLGRGSSLPGAICLKVSPRILRKLKLPKTIVAVTGSNGKTSTSALIAEVAEKAGLRVLCNREGSNQKEGVTTLLLKNANPFTRKVDADVLVLESDERFCQYTFADITPSHIVITNLFRDQLTRNGHPEFVKGELAKGLPQESVLILNANEPTSCSYGFGRENSIYYGVSADSMMTAPDAFFAYNDGAFCPVCGGRMQYTGRISGQVGAYACCSCSFKTPAAAHAVTAQRENGDFVLDGEYTVRPQLVNAAYAQNIAAAYTACTEALGIAPEQAAALLDGIELANGRLVDFEMNGCKGLFMLCKHENSMAYNGGIATALSPAEEALTVVFIVDRLSRKYVANDMSWLWDINFELLADARVKHIVVSGGFAHDVAARMEFAGLDMARVDVCPDLDEMMQTLQQKAEGSIYVFTCFTDQNKFLSRLAKLQAAQEGGSKA
ncbi:MAG: DUF1727 domain-containing protein [Oscillospiraceae bacterium]|nr:DUF1727 domain-containing protein [Oscillospiraceae bacterium]